MSYRAYDCRQVVGSRARISARTSRKVAYLERRTKMSTTEIVTESIDRYYAAIVDGEGSPAEMLERAGFVACAWARRSLRLLQGRSRPFRRQEDVILANTGFLARLERRGSSSRASQGCARSHRGALRDHLARHDRDLPHARLPPWRSCRARVRSQRDPGRVRDLLARALTFFRQFRLSSRSTARYRWIWRAASLVILAEETGTGDIFSTDVRDFGAYRWKTESALNFSCLIGPRGVSRVTQQRPTARSLCNHGCATRVRAVPLQIVPVCTPDFTERLLRVTILRAVRGRPVHNLPGMRASRKN